ncbi:signal peptide peptidase SppA [Hansschlegelia zhihuaiae]|uniref:Signal peptide peptidase SppA n=1 Tax=Hansschlegelia zhihuaiae TaxID=405005 RepID=A0A4Q0MI74_9HYPH|nr:signal peptide peptidase SppA [Hansschlegelia zhihuaiae]RXF72696.1 signal peptide peptidase SppA [Hansschlegelia zhihuaiae]
MPLDADAILDRRALRRRLAFWRIGAIALVGLVIVVGALSFGRGGERVPGPRGPHIAKVEISGVIFDDEKRSKLLADLAKSDAKGVLLMIDSPGGGVTASEDIYEAVRRVAKDRPVAAVVGTLAASGGYVAAIAADHIVARKTSITGSIGVLAQYPNFTELLKTVGVQVESIKSSPLKAAPNGVEPTSPEARKALEALILDSYAWFKSVVAERRGLEGPALAGVSDGRVFTGRQAIELKLVDEIGGEPEAIAWLQTKGVDASLPVKEWKPKSSPFERFGAASLAAALADAFGLHAVAESIRRTGETLVLDGVLAIWHPAG